MLLRFPHDNRYWVAPGESWEFFWICLNGREAQRVWREAMADGPLVRLPEAVVGRLAAICYGALASGFETPARASAVAYEVAMLLVDAVVHGADGPARTVAGIERAVALCDADAVGDHRVDVARLAEAAGLSRYHFSRRFAAERGFNMMVTQDGRVGSLKAVTTTRIHEFGAFFQARLADDLRRIGYDAIEQAVVRLARPETAVAAFCKGRQQACAQPRPMPLPRALSGMVSRPRASSRSSASRVSPLV